MELNYNGKKYELTELCDPQNGGSLDIIAIFETEYVYYTKSNGKDIRIKVSKEQFDADDNCLVEYRFINYFYGASESKENIIESAEYFIDQEWEMNELKVLLKSLKRNQEKWCLETHNENDALDEYDNIIADINNWVKNNVPSDDDGNDAFDQNDGINHKK